MNERVYLDYAATAPLHEAALQAMLEAGRRIGNASSIHSSGRAVRARLEASRRSIAAHLGCEPASLVFTSGGTEALGLALGARPWAATLVAATEHDAVRRQARNAIAIAVDRNGLLLLDELELQLSRAPRPALVAVMAANNETGVLQPIPEVAQLTARHGAALLVDAVQSAGKRPLPVADYVAVSAHKLGGPAGVGALVVGTGATLDPMLRGGGQEAGRRAGTENVLGIAGFAAALEALARDSDWLERATRLRDGLEQQLLARLPGIDIPGRDAPRIGHIACIRLPGVAAMTQLIALDLDGFDLSAGAACSSGRVGPSHVLTAMGRSAAEAAQAIRVSLGWGTAAQEVERFQAAWTAMAERAIARAA